MKILLTEEEIQKQVAKLGQEITAYYREVPEPVHVLALLNGGMLFAADLVRRIDSTKVIFDSIAVSLYEHDQCTHVLKELKSPKVPVKGHHVLLVDELLDTGLTLQICAAKAREMGALSVRTAVLAKKRLAKEQTFQADWIGFTLPDLYLIGYGMDSEELLRNLPFVGSRE